MSDVHTLPSCDDPRADIATLCVSYVAREKAMQVTKDPIETGRGLSEWLTGKVYIDAVATS